ncbi:MAG: hypothetical protein ALAOOOJD_00435 [bacterium]|nr:hypothetical protein [bacterium]
MRGGAEIFNHHADRHRGVHVHGIRQIHICYADILRKLWNGLRGDTNVVDECRIQAAGNKDRVEIKIRIEIDGRAQRCLRRRADEEAPLIFDKIKFGANVIMLRRSRRRRSAAIFQFRKDVDRGRHAAGLKHHVVIASPETDVSRHAGG